MQVVPNGNCTGVTSLTAIVSEFSETEPYKSVYKVSVVHFFPFTPNFPIFSSSTLFFSLVLVPQHHHNSAAVYPVLLPEFRYHPTSPNSTSGRQAVQIRYVRASR